MIAFIDPQLDPAGPAKAAPGSNTNSIAVQAGNLQFLTHQNNKLKE
jgi:hypothetical protein